MSEVQIDLKTPSVLKALKDIPTMQRWEILRRAQRPFTVAELSQHAKASLEEVQRSLDLLTEAGLARRRPASNRVPKISYEAAMERLFLSWEWSDPEAAAAWRELRASSLNYSRRIQDETIVRPRSEGSRFNFGGDTSVLLLKEDAERLREAFRAVYGMLAEADQRARASVDPDACVPLHVSFTLSRMAEPQLPMAEFFVIEKSSIDSDRMVLESSADQILSPRELQIAKLLESGKSRPAIASELGLTLNTVASLSKIIYRKLGVQSRAALTARMRRS